VEMEAESSIVSCSPFTVCGVWCRRESGVNCGRAVEQALCMIRGCWYEGVKLGEHFACSGLGLNGCSEGNATFARGNAGQLGAAASFFVLY
jgi:hypothetical protein